MNKSFFIIRDVFSTIGTALTLIAIYLYISEFMMHSSTFDYAGMAFICIFLVADCIFKRYIHNAIVFIILHLLPFSMLYFVDFKVYQIFLLTLIGAYIFYCAIAYWKKESLEKDSYAIQMPSEMLIFYIIIFIHSSYGLSHELTQLVYISGLCFFLLSLMDKYLSQVIMNTHSANGSNRKIPPKMYSLNSTIIIFFFTFLILFMAFISMVVSDNAFNFVGQFFKFIGYILVLLAKQISGNKTDVENETQQIAKDKSNNIQPQNMDTSSNPLLNAIFNLVQIAIYLFIAFGIIYIIYSFFKSYMYRKGNHGDDTKDLLENDKVVKLSRKPHKISIFTQTTINEKIRKLYKKKIISFNKKDIHLRSCDTANEISNHIKASENVSVADITEIYNLARYSNKQLTKKDVQLYKELIK